MSIQEVKIKGKKILVADDDPAILEVVSIILEDAGYEVETSTGETLLSTSGALPDLYMIDIWMLGKDGREICRHLKSQEQTKNIPILIVSANRDIEQIAQEVGVDAYLSKPFEIDQLIELIQKHIN
ncbi:response regulator [Pedobacter sp. HMF7647]|uniref:Response regulator n=1 Tax=Hufsiella arboris TaxID=2695275 RepID=A0A7K1Y5W8_9SPHI|nr:response regulator [Hufsiella arboris]MXV49418.1 response regulator [Hufsiella arboris]